VDNDSLCIPCQSCQNCVCKDDDSLCSGCCGCASCTCVDEDENCGTGKCCDGCSCVDECAQTAPCTFLWPPVGVPSSGCQSGDPTDLSCPSVLDGQICKWTQTKLYHLTTAECADCDSFCGKSWTGYCVELTPTKCKDNFIWTLGFVCFCNDNGTPIDVGHYETCP